MLTVVIGAVINIALDPVLMFTFQMGVKGAAIATILSQAISSAWVLWFLVGKRTKLKIRKKYFKLHRTVSYTHLQGAAISGAESLRPRNSVEQSCP